MVDLVNYRTDIRRHNLFNNLLSTVTESFALRLKVEKRRLLNTWSETWESCF